MTIDEVKKLIEAGIPDAHATVRDLTGTNDHFAAVVISPAFHGKSVLEMHRMVYAALGAAMKGPIHALQLETRAP
ncbi:MAG: BolA family transcriptional regulator [Deltaproteobacteria bacterium]|nr:BolA family transcriptional regulator [Deltaproteobacteria bacterium]